MSQVPSMSFLPPRMHSRLIRSCRATALVGTFGLRLLTSLALIVGIASNAKAQFITITGSGHFTNSVDLCSGFCNVPDISVGGAFTFSITYASTVTPVVPNNWIFPVPPSQFIVATGSHTFAAASCTADPVGELQIYTHQPPAAGSLTASAGCATPGITYPAGIGASVRYGMSLSGVGDLFPANILPTTFPPLSAYSTASLGLTIERGFFGTLILQGVLDTLIAPPRTPPIVNLSIATGPGGGNQQTANVLTQLPNPLVVKATNPDGSAARSVPIFFTLRAPAGATGASITNTATTTAADGTATTQLSLGDKPGEYQVTASCTGNQSCSPSTVTFTEYGSCLLPDVPEFNWSQSQSHSAPNSYWGNDSYDHSHYFLPPAGVSAPAVSKTGKMQVLIGSTPVAPEIVLSSSQNNLVGLTSALNALPGISAELIGSTLSVYNLACIDGTTCPAQSAALSLCDGVCTGNNNLLIPKTMSEVGCALTALAMACNFAQAKTLNIIPTPSAVQFTPESLNFFMSKTLPSTTPGGQFSADGKVSFEKTVPLLAQNTGLNLSFVRNEVPSQPDATAADAMLNSALCSEHVPVIARVANSYGSAHYVLVTGNTGRGSNPSDGGEYRIADPAGNGSQSLKDYNNAFTTVGFVKDPIDRSSLSVSVGNNANIEVIDPIGRKTGFDPTTGSILRQIPVSSFAIDRIGDDTGQGHDEGGATQTVTIQAPASGTYQVIATGVATGKDGVSVISISQDGHLNADFTQEIITSTGSSSRFQMQYTPSPGAASQVQFLASFQSTLADIANCLSLTWIDNQGVANSLSQKIQAAQAATGPQRNNILNAFQKELNAQAGKHIVGVAVQVLLQDADSLISQNQ